MKGPRKYLSLTETRANYKLAQSCLVLFHHVYDYVKNWPDAPESPFTHSVLYNGTEIGIIDLSWNTNNGRRTLYINHRNGSHVSVSVNDLYCIDFFTKYQLDKITNSVFIAFKEVVKLEKQDKLLSDYPINCIE